MTVCDNVSVVQLGSELCGMYDVCSATLWMSHLCHTSPAQNVMTDLHNNYHNDIYNTLQVRWAAKHHHHHHCRQFNIIINCVKQVKSMV